MIDYVPATTEDMLLCSLCSFIFSENKYRLYIVIFAFSCTKIRISFISMSYSYWLYGQGGSIISVLWPTFPLSGLVGTMVFSGTLCLRVFF